MPRCFEFADVGAVRAGVAGERPDLFNVVAPDPHHAGADGRGEKFVQAGSEVVAVQVGDLEVDRPKEWAPSASDFDVVGVGHVGDFGHGHDLADPVDHVGDVDELWCAA